MAVKPLFDRYELFDESRGTVSTLFEGVPCPRLTRGRVSRLSLSTGSLRRSQWPARASKG